MENSVQDKKILVVDDDEDILASAQLLLKRHVAQIRLLDTPQKLVRLLQTEYFDLILLDMNFVMGDSSGSEGLNWLVKIREEYSIPVVLMTAYAGVELAVKAMKMGAADFVIKPWSNEKILTTIENAITNQAEKKTQHNHLIATQVPVVSTSLQSDQFIGQSSVILELMRKADRCAATDANILLLGENGSGKEMLAREIHKKSKRKDQPFMAIDMGAIPDSLFESELFGYKKGAFTGANQDKIGKISAANGGTLFLDEIGNLPLHLQAKLLRVLELRQLMPLGDSQPKSFDVRIIAATNMPINRLRDEACFRQDLLFRINTVELTLPPLRDRKDDIPVLVNSFLTYFSTQYQRNIPSIDSMLMNRLTAYSWPGNIRALRHAIERALVLSDSDILTLDDFTFLMDVPQIEEQTLDLYRMEKNAVVRALAKHQGNISKTAKDLGLTRAALYRRIEKYDIEKDSSL
jgi:DNA-binding NtrC family response regulator